MMMIMMMMNYDDDINYDDDDDADSDDHSVVHDDTYLYTTERRISCWMHLVCDTGRPRPDMRNQSVDG